MPSRMSLLKKSFSIGLSISLLLLAGGCRRNEPLPPEVSQLLRESLQAEVLPASLNDQKELVKAWEEMQGFYKKQGFQPVWSTSRGPRSQAAELIEAIPALGAEGLDVRRYQPARLAGLLKELEGVKRFADPQDQRRLVDLDLELTYTYLSLATHLGSGRLQPKTIRAEWYTKPRAVDLDARLGHALAAENAGEIVKIFRSLNPPYPDYERLRKGLAGYRGILAKGGWGAVPPGPDLAAGGRGPRVAALRARLAASGDLPGGGAAVARAGEFDGALAAAVSRFQRRHGLEAHRRGGRGNPDGAQRPRPRPHPPAPGEHGALAVAAGHPRRPLHPGQRAGIPARRRRGGKDGPRPCG